MIAANFPSVASGQGQVHEPFSLAVLLPRLFLSQAYRELGAARLFEQGGALTPDDAAREELAEHAAEEREHLEAVVGVWRDFSGEPQIDLHARIEAHLATRPLPIARGWIDLVMARLLFDRAGFVQLREVEDCSYQPYAELCRRIVAQEAGHLRSGEQALIEWCAGGERCAEAQVAFDRWMPVSLLAFGRSGTAASQAAIALGLKRRDPEAVRQDFLAAAWSALRAAGLKVSEAAT